MLFRSRGPISDKALFQLKAFEPTDEELAEDSGDMDIDEDEPRSEDEDSDNDNFEDFDKVVERKVSTCSVARFTLSSDPLDRAQKNKGKKASSSKTGAPKQNNRAIVIDSDDEDEPEAAAPEEMSETKAGKQKAKELPGWMAKQEPSTKLLWLYEEIYRLSKECVLGFVSRVCAFADYYNAFQEA